MSYLCSRSIGRYAHHPDVESRAFDCVHLDLMERPRSEGCAYWSGVARQIARSGYFDFAFSPSSTSGRMVSEGARSKATCLLKSEPLGPPTRILMDRPGVRLTAIDSKRPFLGSVAGISDRSLFLLAPRTCERARQVPHLPSDTSRRIRASALKTTRAARQLRRRTNSPEME